VKIPAPIVEKEEKYPSLPIVKRVGYKGVIHIVGILFIVGIGGIPTPNSPHSKGFPLL
jgi:hypothetical protein